MNVIKMGALVLIAAGIMGLAYGGFWYTRETRTARLGAIELSISNRETVNMPVWVGVGAIIVGGLLLIVPLDRKNG
ncbi:MAG: hypothetical protein HZB23_00730 [Deltaproteobacteria bacterium]|nr:hypothetical protein [Deltaproteobacteria bacterium]